MRTLRVLLLSFALLAAAPAAFTPYLVKDINPEAVPGSSDPDAFVALGNLALFQVRTLGRTELWRSDGTASGTYRLAETGYTEILADTGDRCFFRFQGAGDGRWHLWVTDGTLPGTFGLGETSGFGSYGPAAWVTRQDILYFASDSGQGHGAELWRTDGTPGGTFEVADIVPGPAGSNPGFLTAFQGRIYFAAGSGFWQSDGTAAGTVPLAMVPTASIHSLGTRLVFFGSDAAHGLEPWTSDGTAAGTRRIADLAKGAESPVYQDFQVVGKRLFFTAATGAAGQELYVTDGTAKGTRRITGFSDPFALDQLTQVALGNRLLFAAKNRKHGVELWTSDGTAKGTRMVKDACPGECPSYPRPLLRHQGRLYFVAQDRTHGFELWVTDGTGQGTRMVKDFCPGECSSWPSALRSPGDRLFFSTSDPQLVSTLWTTDGTAEGSLPLAELPNLSVQGTAAGGVLVFGGADPDHGREPWSSDGTPGGTGLLVDIADEDIGGSSPRSLMALGETVLFFGDGAEDHGLWRSDGTEEGTRLVKGGLRGWGPVAASPSRVFFVSSRSEGDDLWTTDGSEAGTLRLTPESVHIQREVSEPVVKLGSRVFFSARSPEHGIEPWVTDGTPAGTRLLRDIRRGTAHSSPHSFTVSAGRVWFVARSGNRQRMWRSDGTAKGTVAVGPELHAIRPWTDYAGRLWYTGRNADHRIELWGTDGTRLAELGNVESLTVHAGRLWFLGNGIQLWSTDGTAAGTRKLDLPVPEYQLFSRIVSDGERLYLTDFEHGLWASDGTAAGTRKISGQGASYIWTALEGRLYYVSYSGDLYTSDGTEAGTLPIAGPRLVQRLLHFGNRLIAVTYGGELWQSDGTDVGTKLVRDLSPVPYDGSEVVKAGPRLFFPAWEEESGWELWAMRE
jgi:ELWxxDGT repeat protein